MIAEASEWIAAVLDDAGIPYRRAIDDRAAIGPVVIVGAPTVNEASRFIGGCAIVVIDVGLTVVPRSTEALDDLYLAVDQTAAALLAAGAVIRTAAPSTYGVDDQLPAYDLTTTISVDVDVTPPERIPT